MHSFEEMVRKYTLHNNNQIKKFCAPLETHFGVNHFWYHELTNDGYYSCVGSHAQWMEYYFAEKLFVPNLYLRNPQNQQNGISFLRNVNNRSFQDSLDLGIQKFNLNQSLVILEKKRRGIRGFGFATKLQPQAFEAKMLHDLPLIQLFIQLFKEKFADLIHEMNNDLIHIAGLIGPSFFDQEVAACPSEVNRTRFLAEMGVFLPLPLTSREEQILHYLLDGYSAGQVAQLLTLSKRTVEGYIQNVKNKLGCCSKPELIQKAHLFKMLGARQ